MMRAVVLMVQYYLELGHDLTIKSYSKDEYKKNQRSFTAGSAQFPERAQNLLSAGIFDNLHNL